MKRRFLAATAEAFAGSPVGVGGQNVHWAESGAWTGEISSGMLAEAGCRCVALAHSERPQHFNETYEHTRLKVDTALPHGRLPVLERHLAGKPGLTCTDLAVREDGAEEY